jgi:hypothetical protein
MDRGHDRDRALGWVSISQADRDQRTSGTGQQADRGRKGEAAKRRRGAGERREGE